MSKSDILDKNKLTNLKILFALMMLGCRSDRELARHLGMTNPTVSRRKKMLEQEGYIKEYTVIPDFHKIGIEYIAISFATTSETVTSKHFEDIKTISSKHPEVLCTLQDQSGVGTTWITISVHTSYEGFSELSKKVQKELISLQPIPRMERRTFMIHTGTEQPKSFSLRNLSSVLFQPEKPLYPVKRRVYS